jgi:DNA polymerase III subunit epsilon
MIAEKIVVFDFETTGLNAQTDQAIEVAAIQVTRGKVTAEFSTLIHFSSELQPKITEITGLTAADLVDAMDELSAFKILRKLMGSDSLIVAHNAAFDLQFLHYGMMRLMGRTFENPFIDTMTISRDRTTYPHKLVDMCEKYGIQLEGAHRALNDVHGCWELLKSLHEQESVKRYVNRLGYLRKYGPPPWAPRYAVLEATDNRYEPKTAG